MSKPHKTNANSPGPPREAIPVEALAVAGIVLASILNAIFHLAIC